MIFYALAIGMPINEYNKSTASNKEKDKNALKKLDDLEEKKDRIEMLLQKLDFEEHMLRWE